MELALCLSLFAVLFVAWCILPNAPTESPRHEPARSGAMQEA